MSQTAFVYDLSHLKLDNIQKIVRATIPRTRRMGFTSKILRNKAALIEQCAKLPSDGPTRLSLTAAIDSYRTSMHEEAALVIERIRKQTSHSFPLHFQCYSFEKFLSTPGEDEVSNL
jgi:hypothetical protein